MEGAMSSSRQHAAFTRVGPSVFSPNLDLYHAVFERDGKRYVGFGHGQTGDYEMVPVAGGDVTRSVVNRTDIGND